ncbi:MAG: hypothetical protein OXT74_15025, partial [Candidatus Poribacteria bacterium]|nr:hypothetical protein [Candidatus Poribacteria bacterium]
FYHQAVCNRGFREFAKAYVEFNAYMNLGRDVEYYQEAEQIIRELETDKDGDRYEFDIEQGVGTSKLRSQQTSGCEFFIGPNFPRKSRELTPGSLAISASQSLD